VGPVYLSLPREVLCKQYPSDERDKPGAVAPAMSAPRAANIRRQGERDVLFAEVLSEKVEFQVREKQKQERRPLTDDEKRWRSPCDNGWKKELVPTGWLVFEIKSWHWPNALPTAMA
jgi:hypothetical protein